MENTAVKRKVGFYEKYIKRLLDIVLSGLALVVLSPVMLVTAILVRVKLGRPVIFSQERPGKDERIFHLHKYRSMSNARDKNGALLPDEQRLGKFGRLLRSTSLDELPELWNILRGDMSIVGPRPLLVEYLPYYTPQEHCRHDVRPGLTGLAQINGRNALSWEEKFKFDLQYVERVSLGGDLKIILKTICKVFQRSDVISGAELAKVAGRLDNERKNAEVHT